MLHNYTKLTKLLIISVSILVISFLLISLAPSKYFSSDSREGISLLRDDQELGVFFGRIDYFYNNGVPYKYSRIEYPPLAVGYLTIPAIFTDVEEEYRLYLIGLNALLAIILVVITYKIIIHIGANKNLLWLFILPSFLYQLLNRFDILPAVLIQLAFLLLFKQKFKWSFLILSLAFLAKGYAIVLFPIFFIYYLYQKNSIKVNIFNNKPLWIFLLPIIFVTIVLFIWAGIENTLFPYIFQSARNFAYGSIYVIYILAAESFIPAWLWQVSIAIFAKVLLFLQIILPLLIYIGYKVFIRFIKSKEDLIRWSLMVILIYILFSSYYSPQWIVWIIPLLILLKLRWQEILIVVFYDIVNYLFFPIALNTVGYFSVGFDIIVFLRTILLVLIIIFIANKIVKNSKLNNDR